MSPDIASNVAVLKRFRGLLIAQRDRFRDYLSLLDKQKDSIPKGTVDELIAHVELEEQVVKDIFALQKVIEPMRRILPTRLPTETENIASAIETLRVEAVVRVNSNKALLKERMDIIQEEMKILRRSPFSGPKQPFGSYTAPPSFIDILG